jgi:hypothetical protein
LRLRTSANTDTTIGEVGVERKRKRGGDTD